MHGTARAFVMEAKAAHPWAFDNQDFDVLDVGSLQVNWSNARFFSNRERVYGIDVIDGPEVDEVVPVHLFQHEPFKVVICTSMLEHDKHWQLSLRRMVELTAPDGLLLITCAGPGYAEHMTIEKPERIGTRLVGLDHYRNISAEELDEHLGLTNFSQHVLSYRESNHDTFFWGIRCSSC